jgi:hypothetical protein
MQVSVERRAADVDSLSSRPPSHGCVFDRLSPSTAILAGERARRQIISQLSTVLVADAVTV